jgi:hypothetical protein
VLTPDAELEGMKYGLAYTISLGAACVKNESTRKMIDDMNFFTVEKSSTQAV